MRCLLDVLKRACIDRIMAVQVKRRRLRRLLGQYQCLLLDLHHVHSLWTILPGSTLAMLRRPMWRDAVLLHWPRRAGRRPNDDESARAWMGHVRVMQAKSNAHALDIFSAIGESMFSGEAEGEAEGP